MQRIGILNMFLGFMLIFLAASAGAFVAMDATHRFLDGVPVATWRDMLQASAHGHTSLFGIIHISFGITLPYSILSQRLKKIQTVGIFCGAMAMGPMMMIRAALGPTPTYEWNGLLIGGLLTLALFAIAGHAYGLLGKILSRP